MRPVLALAFALLAACSLQPASEAKPTAAIAPSVHPVSGLSVIPLAVTGTKGRHAFRVEVARTEEEQAKGLMFRTSLGPDEGMLFPRKPPDQAVFWMKDTPLPLDIIFIGTDHRVINIQHGQPYRLDPLPALGIAAAVLEIADGRAEQLGIGPGSTVDW